MNHLHLSALPLAKRLVHWTTLRHAAGVTLGAALMLTGSAMATHADFGTQYVPHVLWDSVAYFIHGFGSLPVLWHLEPLWRIVTATQGGGD